MHNQLNKEKLVRFANDLGMSKTIYDFLLNEFLSDNVPNDVNMLSASRLAIRFLNDAWGKLEGYKVTREESEKKNVPIGL